MIEDTADTQIDADLERPAWINELEQKLSAVDWTVLREELGREGFSAVCDIVGIRVARQLSNKGLTVRAVQAILPGYTDMVTNDQAEVAFIIGDDEERYLVDFTYGYYAPDVIATLAKTTAKKPYLILPYKDKIPKINGKELFRGMYIEGEPILLAEGMEEKDVTIDPIQQAVINSARISYSQKVETAGYDMYGGLPGYIRSMYGINLGHYGNILTSHQKRLMMLASLHMNSYLKNGICNEDLYIKRWIAPVQSGELNRLIGSI